MIENVAFVQHAEETEQRLVQRAQDAGHAAAWVIGECAAKWYKSFAAGRMDKDFGAMVDMTGDQVNQRRLVWERFGERGLHRELRGLSWSHFREACYWDDADDILTWASQAEATVKEMIMWRRSKHGEPLFPVLHQPRVLEPEKPEEAEDKTTPRKDEASTRVPASVNRNRETVENPDRARSETLKEQAAAGSGPDTIVEVDKGKKDKEAAAEVILQIKELVLKVDRIALQQQKEALAKELSKFVERVQHKVEAKKADVAGMAVKVQEAWNAVPGFVKCKSMNESRKAHVAARAKDPFWKEHWQEALQRIVGKAWFLGQNRTAWVANLDWFLRPEVVAKIMEGRYDNLTYSATPLPQDSAASRRAAANRAAFNEVLGSTPVCGDEDAVF
jgi:hypothetical protein